MLDKLSEKPIRLYLLSALVFIAGIIHLISPEKFLPAIPPFIPYAGPVVYLTGVLEIVLALFLLRSRTQDLAAKILAVYFLALLPVHIYVSYYGIEMFGVDNKLLLWARTLFQFVFYFWALSLQKESWVIKQVWRDVLFIHYRISPEKIKHLVPFELDLYENQAILSVIPFYMDSIRFPFLPPIPKISSLWELNIRTYVNVNGVKGIYFFTLETDSKIAELIARLFFHLPYRHSKIKAKVKNDSYLFEHSRADLHFSIDARPKHNSHKTAFDTWATERYSLFTTKNAIPIEGIVQHAPWELGQVDIAAINNHFTKMVTPEVGDIFGASYAKEMKVSFKNFSKIPS